VSVRAVLFDLNGTLSHDEPLWAEIYREVFAAHGRPISPEEYFEQLAGLSDAEAAATWLGADHPELAQVVEDAVARFRQAARDGSTVAAGARDAVVEAASAVPVGVVTTATRAVLDEVLAAAGLDRHVAVTVAAEDVTRTKPDPEGYLTALHRLSGSVSASEVLVFEDTPIGIAAAQAAGMRCVAVLGTSPRKRLAAAEEIIDELDRATVRRLLV
jgi:HAD superfamily hydrolase (TIGR01509 family)